MDLLTNLISFGWSIKLGFSALKVNVLAVVPPVKNCMLNITEMR